FEIIRKQAPQPPSLMLKGATGLGKTVFLEHIRKANKGCKFIAVSCKRTLSNMNADRLELENYQDLPAGLIACDKVAIQAESLFRLQMTHYEGNFILFLDETSSLFSQMNSRETMGDKLELNNQILRGLIAGATRVICLDADLTNEDVQLVKSLRNDVVVVHNQFKAQEGDKVVMYEKKSLLISDIMERLRSGERVWISSTLSADTTKSLHEYLRDAGFNGKFITGDSDEDDKRYISQNINK
ncbi:hypothetical protein BGZ49_006172, partial [Haplosporangium sp. Z 27]